MPSINDLFKADGTATQFLIWNVLTQLVGAYLAPVISDIQQEAFSRDASLPLTPQQLAVLVARGFVDQGAAAGEAAKSGVGPGRFAQLVQLAESPADLGLVLQAARRLLGQVGPGMAVPVNLDTVLTDLGVADGYQELVKAAVLVQPSAAEVLNAWLEGQIDADEATARIKATGLDPTWIQTAYNANGQAPTPTQALELWNRGIIAENGTGPDSTSYEQAFLEGPWRNKWLEAFKALRIYLTPPRTVTAQYREGSITRDRAVELLTKNGLDEQSVAEYLVGASHTVTATQRELTQAQVIAAYEDGLLTQTQAHDDLVALRFSASDATLLLALADKKKALAASKSAINRLQTLYLAGTNSAVTTRTALHTLGVADDQATALLATWDLERHTVTKTLTAAEIVQAVYYEGMTVDTALTRLQALGYDAVDAQIIVYNRLHGYPKTWVKV